MKPALLFYSVLLLSSVSQPPALSATSSASCAFLKKDKGEMMDLKKPAIRKDIEEITLSDGAIARIRRTTSELELSITSGEREAKITTKPSSLSALTLKSGTLEYQLQCSL